jgi:hypothetical protein
LKVLRTLASFLAAIPFDAPNARSRAAMIEFLNVCLLSKERKGLWALGGVFGTPFFPNHLDRELLYAKCNCKSRSLWAVLNVLYVDFFL